MKQDPSTLPPEAMLSMAQAARLLGVSEKYFRLKVAQGDIRVIRWASAIRVPRWSLQEWQREELFRAEHRAEEMAREANSSSTGRARKLSIVR